MPTVSFTGTPLTGVAPLTVAFTNTSDFTPTNGVWSWSFGDGATSTVENPTHVYAAPGSYDVTLSMLAPTSFFTSVLYPTLVADALAVATPALRPSALLTVPADAIALGVPGLTGGTLVPTISYLTYNAPTDAAQVAVPVLNGGTLVVTIAYPTYQGPSDGVALPIPTLNGGTLVVTIAYVTYTYAQNFPDTLGVPVPTLIGGTLA